MSDVKADISERTNILYMCTYKSLVFGAKTLEIIFISGYQVLELLLQMFPLNILTHFRYALVLFPGYWLASENERS